MEIEEQSRFRFYKRCSIQSQPYDLLAWRAKLDQGCPSTSLFGSLVQAESDAPEWARSQTITFFPPIWSWFCSHFLKSSIQCSP